jgi:hypothetical protein
MIEREAQIKVYNETLGAKGTRARLVRIAPEGFYEVTLESQGKFYTTLLPISTTVILAAEPEEDLPTIDVER